MEDKTYFLSPSGEKLIEFESMHVGYPYVCSRCCQTYQNMGYARWHYTAKCQLGLSDGIHVIDKTSPKKLKQVANNMGHLSAATQGIDLRVTSTEKINDPKLCTKVFLLVHEGHPIGILTMSVRTFEKDGVTLKWLDDFYVMQPYQRKGFGTRLFDFALKHQGLGPYDFVYDQPKPGFINLLKNHGIDIKKLNSPDLFKSKPSA